MIRVLHVIIGLGQGGAETMLWKLLCRTDPVSFCSSVVSLTDDNTLEQRIAALGIPVYKLGLRSMGTGLKGLGRLWHLARRLRPDLIQGWMSHGNLLGLMARVAAPGNPALIWGIRQSVYDLNFETPSTARLIRLSAKLSRQPRAIVYNSHTARAQHEALGFSRLRGKIIPNGFDVSVFAPSSESRSSFRQELGLPESMLLVGIVGRYHPMKDHRNFIKAARGVRGKHPQCRFVMIGPGMIWSNNELVACLKQAGIADATILLGSREDMPKVNAALDVVASSSFTEAFSNSIGEAMSCGVPCVVTNVGDSALLVGDTGVVTPPRDAEALASGINQLLELTNQDRRALGAAARERVAAKFSLDEVVASFNSLYLSVVEEQIA
jgi:glycosyltransferase involved in cell wall biosynthesis